MFFGFVLPYRETLLTFYSFCSDSGMFSECCMLTTPPWLAVKPEPGLDTECSFLAVAPLTARPDPGFFTSSACLAKILSYSRLRYSANCRF